MEAEGGEMRVEGGGGGRRWRVEGGGWRVPRNMPRYTTHSNTYQVNVVDHLQRSLESSSDIPSKGIKLHRE